jgi:hypothetical protein
LNNETRRNNIKLFDGKVKEDPNALHIWF